MQDVDTYESKMKLKACLMEAKLDIKEFIDAVK